MPSLADPGRLADDYRKVAAIAGLDIGRGELVVEVLPAPHRPPGSLPLGKSAVYVFFWHGQCLKVGKAGPRSNARYTSQHYLPGSSASNLSRSLLLAQESLGLDLDQASVAQWIRANTERWNFLLDSSLGIPALTLLEAFLQCRLRPRFEGFESQR